MTLRQACSRDSPRAQFAFKDSMIHWSCNSHYVSHFAAFFIDARAKRSTVKSCSLLRLTLEPRFEDRIRLGSKVCTWVKTNSGPAKQTEVRSPTGDLTLFRATPKYSIKYTAKAVRIGFVNDPSAGSPTETLLRLLLPLNDQV